MLPCKFVIIGVNVFCFFCPSFFEIILFKISKIDGIKTETKEKPSFGAGDTISVSYKIKEGNKERIQIFKGVVIQIKGTGSTKMVTVRKMSGSHGVERIFPMESPFIESIEVNRRGKVRRKRIYYLRERTGKKARIKEKRRI